ncbi:MAG: hypothetical protein RQ847_10255 [Wenzhouxiangellaceae bacterium]|nr:hypothetical protein [Wenzhouxiangellaceae bacterium]
MNSIRITALLLAALLLAAPLPRPVKAQQPASVAGSAAHTDPVDATDILDRIERFGALSAENAALILEGLDSMDHPTAHLDAGLLRIYGPVPHRDLQQGILTLNALLESDNPTLEGNARRLIGLVVDHTRHTLIFERRLRIQAEEIERQREANRQAQEKLDALRRIDGALESGPQAEPEPDTSDDDGNGNR